jgi:hypothetical protein
MFRNIAIALVAASVLAAPAMAQNNTLSGGSPSSQTKPSTESTEKADKTPDNKSADSTVSSEKSATKHHRVARHHHHGTKAARLGKSRRNMALYGKHHGVKGANYARYESRRMGHGRSMGHHAYGKLSHRTGSYGRASKHMHMPSKSTNSPSVD